MRIRFTKGKRGDVLTCVRDDGSATWMHERPGFVEHDLMHYAVETVFDYRLGFFGLVAHGWDFAEMGTVDPATGRKRPLPGPPEVPGVEYIVGLFRQDRAGLLRPEDFPAALELETGGAPVPAPFTPARIGAARREIAMLLRRWEAVPPGGTLELPFPEPPRAGQVGRPGAT